MVYRKPADEPTVEPTDTDPEPSATSADADPAAATAADALLPAPVGSPAERLLMADNIVKNHVIVALSLGLVPLPLFDLALLSGNSVLLVRALSQLYDVPFEQHRVQAIVVSLVGGSLPVLGVMGLSAGAKWLPGIGSLLGSGAVAVTGGALTYAVGQIFIRHFEGGGTLLDLDPSRLRERFRAEVANGRAVAAKARASATDAAAH